jgi:predicted PurR-regulated permease PerM
MIDGRDGRQRALAAGRSNPLITAGVIIVAVVAMYVGAGIFVPLVLSVLLAFALAPLVNRLRHLRIPHIAAVIISVALAALVLVSIGYVVATQVVKLAADLPSYQSTVAAKLKLLQASLGGEHFLDRFGTAIDQLKAQFAPNSATTSQLPAQTPLPVTVANTPENPLGMVQTILGSVLGPLATAAIVVVFLIFLLLERADLRDRFLKLVSRGDLRTSTKVMNEAAARVGRYLLVQFGVNLTYGLIFGTGLTLIGVPTGILWGLLATLFRYIPFVGTLLVATIPFTLAFAVDPGWSMLLKSVALFVGLEMITTNAIEPRLYGSSTGLSPLAVLVAAMFWATLWGPIGLILSTPLTVCLVVLGRYVPQLQFLEIMLGSEPVLRPEERLYQRLVAGNTEEAIELAEEGEGEDPVGFYANVLIPALRLAEADLSANPADLQQRRQVVESLEGVVDELEQDVEIADAPPQMLVVGGRTELDGAAARILASVVQREGIQIKVLPPVAVRREALDQLDTDGIEAVCLVYLGDRMRSYARFAARRLKRRHPGLRIAVCVLSGTADASKLTPEVLHVDAVAVGIGEAVRILTEWQSRGATPSSEPSATELEDRLERLRVIVRTDAWVTDFLRHVAEQMGVAVAMATIIEPEIPESPAREPAAAEGRVNGPRTLIHQVVETAAPLVVTDASKDKELAEDAFLLESGVRFFAGVPLAEADGRVIGALTLMDETPQELGSEERARLSGFATELMPELLARASRPSPAARADEPVRPGGVRQNWAAG